MNDTKLFIPIEVLTFNDLNMVIIPFGKMMHLKIPFRFEKKWYRRTSKTSTDCKEIKLLIENKQLIMLDFSKNSGYYWQHHETILNSENIAVFKEFLTKNETKFQIAKLNIK